MKTKPELMPCPWCRVPAVIEERYVGVFVVACHNCECQMQPRTSCYPTRKQAIAAWTPKEER